MDKLKAGIAIVVWNGTFLVEGLTDDFIKLTNKIINIITNVYISSAKG